MFKKNFPLLIVLTTIILIIVSNASPAKFLIGWDNLLPELNIWINLKRSFFSVWQEHQGLGLLAGNAHATEFIYQIYILMLSFILPTTLIREAFSFIMLSLGAIGSFSLIKYIVGNEKSSLGKITPMLGALFYVLNLSTIQTFYVPFEPFIIHYGFLPLLILSFFKLLKENSLKNTLIFVLLNILAIPQGQVPTIFFVYGLILAIISLYLNVRIKTKEFFLKTLKAFLVILIINSFWLLPFIYFSFTNSQVAFEAKINQMSTETVFLQNKEFGGIKDVMLLKGFWFNNVDPDIYGNFSYMLSPWKNYLGKIYVSIIGYILFAIVLLGLIKSFKRKLPALNAFIILFIFSFTMLATTTLPFSLIDNLLREIPLVNQAFRFPFTKFSIITSLCFAIFFAIGSGELIFKFKKLNSYFLSLIFVLILVIFTLPVFQGNLFYYKNSISIPSEYFELFDYFKTQDQNSRIANFPQYTFWGWNFYEWGYGGSGFLWYGIKQPILDRAFDVWSKEDENYYWEISNALNTNNSELFEQILNKYQISFILLDKNIINPSSPTTLLTARLEKIIEKTPSIKKDKSFGKITVYKVSLKDNPKNYIFTERKLKTVNTYKWSNFDKAYLDLGNYISSNANPDIIYPFRSLFYGRSNQNNRVSIESNNNLEISSDTLEIKPESRVSYLFDISEELVFVEFTGKKNPNETFSIQASVKNPEISIISNNQPEYKFTQTTFQKEVFILPKDTQYPLSLNAGGFASLTIKSNSIENIGSTSLSLNKDNLLALTNNKNLDLSTILLANELRSAISIKTENVIFGDISGKLKIILPKITNEKEKFIAVPNNDILSKSKNCDNFRKGKIESRLFDDQNKTWLRMEAKNAANCISYYLPSFNHLHGYMLFIENKNVSGRPFHFWILNEDEKIIPIDTYLDPKNNLSVLILPPQSKDDLSFSLHFESISIGSEKTINDLGKIEMYPIPYNFLTSISIEKEEKEKTENLSVSDINHPNESLYIINSVQGENGTIILSQSYNPGWKAYLVKDVNLFTKALPFLFGKEIKDHVLINNWENGWNITNFKEKSIIIVYLPQYLEYFGILLLLLIPALIYTSRLKN
ncbi:MAG TPA: hypothetical protein VFD45_00505 [Patescibacteria group bacterium]|nr:hypothetical protein [Patescibacteria group bacterium]